MNSSESKVQNDSSDMRLNIISKLDAAKTLLDLSGQVYHFNACDTWTRVTDETEEPLLKRYELEGLVPTKNDNRSLEIEKLDKIIKGLLKKIECLQSQVHSMSNELDAMELRSKKHKKSYPKTKIKTVNQMSGEMVSIGDGNAVVPAKLLKNMNWSSYTNSTRKLLTAVFPRNVLATHSLTGKRSPAFPNKAAKKILEPALVNDIVQTVVERCKVPENLVRTSITTKCADESKRVRNAKVDKKKRKTLKKENISPPDGAESD
ncbi:unnamed protein product [Leptosia nina]|uniref:BEN domain-containing protein n=1 Tax=Leptosia nina TaxID=320188 RepID=A0AAV1JLG5_9NEOP